MRSIVLAVAILAGCASGAHSSFDQGVAAFEQGDYASAEALFTQAASDGRPQAWHNLAITVDKMGRRDEAIRYLNMGARFGLAESQQALVRIGHPVPAPDLAQARAQNAASAASTLLMMRALQPQPQIYQPPPIQMPRQTNCTSRVIGNSVHTSCY